MPRARPGRVGVPAPQIDHRFAVDGDAHRRADLGIARKTLFEHRANGREPLIHEPLHGAEYPAAGRAAATEYHAPMLLITLGNP
nr:hypothetical protein GCM10020063_055670 [Dactylosporangium thailandense]